MQPAPGAGDEGAHKRHGNEGLDRLR